MLGIVANSRKIDITYEVGSAVLFDSTTPDVITMTSFGGGQYATISYWFRMTTARTTTSPNILRTGFIVHSGWLSNGLDQRFEIYAPDGRKWRYRLPVPATNTSWHHIIASVNMLHTGSTSHCYLDGVSQTPVDGNALVEDVTKTDSMLLGPPVVEDIQISDFYCSDEFIDLSSSTNRLKFRTAGGKPEDIGYSGSIPTGSAPQIFHREAAADWNAGTNFGSGGDGSMSGSVTDATDV